MMATSASSDPRARSWRPSGSSAPIRARARSRAVPSQGGRRRRAVTTAGYSAADDGSKRPPPRRGLRADRGDEVRRHLGGRRRAGSPRRRPDRPGQGGGLARGRRPLRTREDDRRPRGHGARGLRAPRSARDGHAALHRRADLVRAYGHGHKRPRPRGDLAHGLAGGDRHRHLAHQGAHPRRPRRPHRRRAPRGEDRARGGVSGGLDRRRCDHPRPWGLGHHRRGPGRRSGRRRVRDLHRRRGRVQRRPADRPRRPQARPGLLRGDARDVGLGRPGAPATLGRVRP